VGWVGCVLSTGWTGGLWNGWVERLQKLTFFGKFDTHLQGESIDRF